MMNDTHSLMAAHGPCEVPSPEGGPCENCGGGPAASQEAKALEFWRQATFGTAPTAFYVPVFAELMFPQPPGQVFFGGGDPHDDPGFQSEMEAWRQLCLTKLKNALAAILNRNAARSAARAARAAGDGAAAAAADATAAAEQTKADANLQAFVDNKCALFAV